MIPNSPNPPLPNNRATMIEAATAKIRETNPPARLQNAPRASRYPNGDASSRPQHGLRNPGVRVTNRFLMFTFGQNAQSGIQRSPPQSAPQPCHRHTDWDGVEQNPGLYRSVRALPRWIEAAWWPPPQFGRSRFRRV